MTLGEQIIQEAVTRVNAAEKPAGLVTVERNRTSPLTRDDLGAACFYRGRERVQHADAGDDNVPSGAVLRVMQFEAELRWEGEQSDGDALYKWVVSQICANNGSLGGLATTTREADTEWFIEPADILLQALTITFESEYFTDAENMEFAG